MKNKNVRTLFTAFTFVAVLLLTGCGGGATEAATAVGRIAAPAVMETTAAAAGGYEGEAVFDAAAGAGASGSVQLSPEQLAAAQQAGLPENTGGTEKQKAEETAEEEQATAAAQEHDAEAEPETSEISRKLIRNVSISAETREFDTSLSLLSERIDAFGGYTEEMNSYAPSGDSSQSVRNAYIRARIPADRLDEFLSTAFSGVHITNRSETTQDVTLQYTDMDARKRVLRLEQERLMELLAEAQSTDSLIALEQRLSEIRYEIESLESQLRVYDNQVQYSTVDVSLQEVKTIAATEEDGFAAQLVSGFSDNLRRVGNFLRNALLFLLTGIPVILPVAVILILVYSISKWVKKGADVCRERKKARAGKRTQRSEAALETAVQRNEADGRNRQETESRQQEDPKAEIKDSNGQNAADDEAGKTGIHRS